jgi:hypothetical protein
LSTNGQDAIRGGLKAIAFEDLLSELQVAGSDLMESQSLAMDAHENETSWKYVFGPNSICCF